MESVIAERYSTALFEAGKEENCLDRLFEESQYLEGMIREVPEFVRVFQNPQITREVKHELLGKWFHETLTPYWNNLLFLLSDKGRIGELPQIIEAFRKQVYEDRGIREIEAVTAIPLSEELKEKLTEKLSSITGKTVYLTNKVDPSIVGGLILNMDHDQIDGSVKGRLEGLKKQISSIIA